MFGLGKAQKIKKDLSIEDVLTRYGVTLKNASATRAMGLCPFHDDHNPSLFVDLEKGTWRCFAGCGSGSVIDFVMKAEGIEFKDAVEKLDRIELPNGVKTARPPQTAADDIQDLKVLQDAVEYYHRVLLANKTAQDYLRKRGIFSAELVDRFRIGYADGSLKKLLHGEDLEKAKAVGILADKGREVFAGYLVFPVQDETGTIVNLYGRLVGDSAGPSTGSTSSRQASSGRSKPKHRYLKGTNRGVFNGKAMKVHKEIVVVESIIDCLSMIVMGVPNCVPLYGTGGLTTDHLDLFAKHATEEIILMMDNDQAGNEAVESILRRVKRLGVTVSKATLPAKVTDPNDLLQKRGSYLPVERLLEARETLGMGPIGHSSKPIAGHEGNGNGHLAIDHDGIRYTARGLRAVTDTAMRVLVEARSNGHAHTDKLDLYVSRSRKTFTGHAARAMNMQQAKIEEGIRTLMHAIEERRRRELEDKRQEPAGYKMSVEEHREALAFLKEGKLLDRLNAVIERMGYVGEDANRKLAYLVAVSSKLDSPLSLLVRSSSSAGKSELLEKVVALMPEEDVFFLSRISPQALYYMPPDSLVHKIVIVDEKHGAEEAEYSIRNLQSRKKLSMAVVMKDPSTGKAKTTIFEVLGPIAYMDGSTSTRDNPENENRCFVVYLDESAEQTDRVVRAQNRAKTLKGKKTLQGLDEEVRTAKNAVRLLDPLRVTIPFMDKVTFPTEYLRARRDNLRFLNLIETIAFLHQHQRDKKLDPAFGAYIEATRDDYRTAYELVRSTVGATYGDIPRSARLVLEGVRAAVAAQADKEGVPAMEYEFTRRQVRGWLHLSQDQVKRSLRTLVDLEYVRVVSGRNGSRYVYRLGESDEERSVIEGITSPEEL